MTGRLASAAEAARPLLGGAQSVKHLKGWQVSAALCQGIGPGQGVVATRSGWGESRRLNDRGNTRQTATDSR